MPQGHYLKIAAFDIVFDYHTFWGLLDLFEAF